MLEKETEAIIKAVTHRVVQSGTDAIAIKDILAADIPHPIKTFFRADVEAMLLAEQRQYRTTSRFNYDYHEVQSLQEQINSILVLNFTFHPKEFEHRLNDAVHMIVNYLIRPQWTLSSVIFEKEKSITPQGLLRLLRYFGPYEYLKEIITHYLKEKKPSSITRDEFKLLIWKIDGKYLLKKTGNEVVRTMSPLFDFFDFQMKTGNNALPIKSLIKFFEDKGLVMVLPRLEGEIAQSKNEMNHTELGNTLEDIRRTLGAFQVEKIEVEDKELIQKSENVPDQAARRVNDEKASTKFDFESSISESDKRKFINKIFLQDEQAYRTMLKELSKQTTWKQASKFVDETFIKNNIDPYSPEATKFLELFFNHFHPKK